MKRLAVIIVLLTLSSFISNAQTKTPFASGNWELNFSGSAGSYNYTYEYSSKYSSSSNDRSHTYFQIAVIPAFFIADGLSIEPEINCFFMDQNKPSYSFLGNLAYTFQMENQNFAPFIRAGYGISNAMQFPIQNGYLSRMSNELDTPIFNAGAGMKYLLTNEIVFRAEINYRSLSFTNENSYSGYSSNTKYKYSFVSILLGFSVLL